MTLAEFFGCSSIAFGPPLAMFIFTITNDPIRIIVLFVAAAFWLMSLIISSLFWLCLQSSKVSFAFAVVFSVLCQEGVRCILYYTLKRSQEQILDLREYSRTTQKNHGIAYAAGFGFGVISALFALANLLADTIGPGTIGLEGDHEYFLMQSAAQTLFIVLLHAFWSIIFFNALDDSNSLSVIYVISSHLLVSLITFLNEYEFYSTTLIVSNVVTILTGYLAFKTAGGSFRSFKNFINSN